MGSREKCSVTAAIWVVLFCNFGTGYSFGIYFVPISRAFNIGRWETAMFGSLLLSIMILSSIPIASFAKTSIRWTFSFCGFLLGLGLVIASFAESSAMLCCGILIAGSGLGTAIMAPLVVRQWSGGTWSSASVLVTFGGGLGIFGFAIGFAEFMQLWDKDTVCDQFACGGWRDALRGQAVGVMAILLVAGSFVSGPPIYPKTMILQSNYSHQQIPSNKSSVSLRNLTWTPCLRSLILYSFVMSFGISNLFVHIVASTDDKNISQLNGAIVLGALGLSLALGMIVFEYGTDHNKNRRLLLLKISTVSLAVVICAWSWIESLPEFLIFAILFGFFASAFFVIPPFIIAEYYGSRSGNELVQLHTLTTQARFPGTLLGPPIAGWIFDIENDYHFAAVFSGFAFLLGFVALLYIPSLKYHNSILDLTYVRSEANTHHKKQRKSLEVMSLSQNVAPSVDVIIPPVTVSDC